MCSDAPVATGTCRRTATVLCAVCAAFVIYGSLVPLQRAALSPDEAWRAFQHIEFVSLGTASKTDSLANFLLYLPLGVCLSAMLIPWRARLLARIGAALAVCGIAAVFGLTVEFLQIFFPPRVPSLNDVLAQTAGALIGSLLWHGGGVAFVSALDRLRAQQPRAARFILAFAAYAVVYAVVAWSPFDFTLRPAEVWEKFRAGRISLHLLPSNALGVLDMLPLLMLVAPLGWLAVAAGECWRPALRTRVLPLAVGCAIVSVAELGQVFLLSRYARLGDVAVGVAGVCLGALMVRVFFASDVREARPGSRLWRVARLGAAAAGAVIVIFWSWRPFDFIADADFVRGRLHAFARVPLESYFVANPLDALSDASAKAGIALGLGALLQAAIPPEWPRGVRLVLVAAALLAIYTVAEVGQLFLPGRYPDSTDVLLGAVAGCCGAVALAALLPRK